MTFGLSDRSVRTVQSILQQEPAVERAILFGSRAKGTHRPGSDIDLALVGPELQHTALLRLMRAFADSSLPYTVDLAVWHLIEDPELRSHIDRRGVPFYERDLGRVRL